MRTKPPSTEATGRLELSRGRVASSHQVVIEGLEYLCAHLGAVAMSKYGRHQRVHDHLKTKAWWCDETISEGAMVIKRLVVGGHETHLHTLMLRVVAQVH